MKTVPDGFEDGLVAEMGGKLDLERAVVEQLGRSGAGDLVHLVEPCPGKKAMDGACSISRPAWTAPKAISPLPSSAIVSEAGSARSRKSHSQRSASTIRQRPTSWRPARQAMLPLCPPTTNTSALAALRAALEAQSADLATERAARMHLEAEIADQNAYAARLETLLRELQRARFGPRSDKLHPDHLALALEDIETAVAETKTGRNECSGGVTKAKKGETPKPRRALPATRSMRGRLSSPSSLRSCFGRKLFIEAQAWIRLPSTLKCWLTAAASPEARRAAPTETARRCRQSAAGRRSSRTSSDPRPDRPPPGPKLHR